MSMMNTGSDVLIIGAGGKIARAVTRLFLAETDWHIGLASGQDISGLYEGNGRVTIHSVPAVSVKEVRKLCTSQRPRVIVNCAAMTNVDVCESDRQLASTLNVKAVENLVSVCNVLEAHLIHYSTDYVFNGEKGPYVETDTPDPINYYGRTKLAGENAILSSKISATILRTNVVYGRLPGVKTDFVTWVRDSCSNGSAITVADDQWGNPTPAADIALATLRALERRRKGLYHIGGADYLNRFMFAQRIAALFALDASLIEPVRTEALQQSAKRPLRAGLVTLKAETELGIKPTNINDGLIEYLRESGQRSRLASHVPANVHPPMSNAQTERS